MTEPTQELTKRIYTLSDDVLRLKAENAALRSQVADLQAKVDIAFAGEAPDTWPCGCRCQIVDSWGMREPVEDENRCDYHLALRAEAERLRADNLSSLLRGRKLEREWWLSRVGTCENGGDIADLMEEATLQIEQLPDPASWGADDA